jgi:hypothetical protein
MALALVRRPLATTTKLYHHCTIARVREISAVSVRVLGTVQQDKKFFQRRYRVRWKVRRGAPALI